jgi:formylglycine-generating enzyme required for sulfatase activity
MIPVATASRFYCIDQTEVTNAQYGAFLPTAPATQIPECSWNTSFAPQTAATTCVSPLPYDPVNRASYPVSCVDWCDAYAYCVAAGKRLCGAIGGGAVAAASTTDANQSQWYRACSAAGARRYPYGNQYQPMHCQGVDGAAVATVAVASLPT